MTTELGELRIASARFETEAKDGAIVLDTYKDKVAELQRDLEEQRGEIDALKHTQVREKDEEKEKRKAEMLQDMLSKIDIVSIKSITLTPGIHGCSFTRASRWRSR